MESLFIGSINDGFNQDDQDSEPPPQVLSQNINEGAQMTKRVSSKTNNKTTPPTNRVKKKANPSTAVKLPPPKTVPSQPRNHSTLEGDLEGVIPTAADIQLREVYGDHIHQNDGSHLDGGISSDQYWQEKWKEMITLPSRRVILPSGVFGRRFLDILISELK